MPSIAFPEHGFFYVNTPIITASDCEAGDLFKVTTLDMHEPPRSETGCWTFPGLLFPATYLTVSGQLEGEAFAASLGKIYTFGPTFQLKIPIRPDMPASSGW